MAVFRRGIHTASERVYSFLDRKGRELVLTPDSTPAVMRWYLEVCEPNTPIRVCFEAPLVRYRHFTGGLKRHFTQIGYTFINEPEASDIALDEHALTILRATIRAVQYDLGIRVSLRVTDLGLHYRLLAAIGLDQPKARDVLHGLRVKNAQERVDWINAFLPDTSVRYDFLRLLQIKWMIPNGAPPDGLAPYLLLGLNTVDEFARAAIDGLDINVEVVFDDFHASEIQDGIAFQLRTVDTRAPIADGGCYRLYAQAFDSRIRNVKSIATSTELLVHAMRTLESIERSLAILVLHIDASLRFVSFVSEMLLAAGYPVIVRPIQGKQLKKALRAYGSNHIWMVLLGKNEEEEQVVSVKNLVDSKTHKVSLANLAAWFQRNMA